MGPRGCLHSSSQFGQRLLMGAGTCRDLALASEQHIEMGEHSQESLVRTSEKRRVTTHTRSVSLEHPRPLRGAHTHHDPFLDSHRPSPLAITSRSPSLLPPVSWNMVNNCSQLAMSSPQHQELSMRLAQFFQLFQRRAARAQHLQSYGA